MVVKYFLNFSILLLVIGNSQDSIVLWRIYYKYFTNTVISHARKKIYNYIVYYKRISRSQGVSSIDISTNKENDAFATCNYKHDIV